MGRASGAAGLAAVAREPMASSLAEADAMIEVCARHDVRWAINLAVGVGACASHCQAID